MADYWIKLYTEIVDDPKMALLPDRLWRRTIELFLVAKKVNKGGELPATREIAWLLRLTDVDELEGELEEIENLGIIERIDQGWYVVNFAKRQEAVPDAERQRQSRQRRMRDEYHQSMSRNVTSNDDTSVTNCDGEAEEEAEAEKEAEEESEAEAEGTSRRAPVRANPVATAVAISQAGEMPELAFAEDVYTAVTEMAAMPPSIRAPACEIILALRGRFPEKSDLVAYLRPYFDDWRQKRGKSGRAYSPLGVGWLEWALAGHNGNGKAGANTDDLRKYAEQWKRRRV